MQRPALSLIIPVYNEEEIIAELDLRLKAFLGALDETWEVTAFVKNIGDDRDVILRDRPSTVTDARVSDLTDPRTYGVRVTYNFR